MLVKDFFTGSSQWVVSRTIIVPGIRYYRDGSGEPDSADVDELGTFSLSRPALVPFVLAEIAKELFEQSEGQDAARLEYLERRLSDELLDDPEF